VSGTISAKKEGDVPPVHALAATSDGYSLRFSLNRSSNPAPGQGDDSRGHRKGRRLSASAV
jgi:hypothetical protein